MAGGRTIAPRTVLERLLRQQDRTYEEIAHDFEILARNLGERGATITARHLRRLASGERTGATPTTRRVLQAMFSRSMDELLQPIGHEDSAEHISIGHVLPTVYSQREALVIAAQRSRAFTFMVQTSMSSEVIEQVIADVHQLALEYPRRPLSETLSRLIDTQCILFSLLAARLKPSHARQLYFLAGALGGLLANASHDLADPHTALTQARTAFICAEQADHDGLRAWIRGMQSLISYRAGRPEESLRYAQSGASFANAARNTTAVWLPINEARAWASLHNARQVRAAIDRAERAWERVQPDDLDELGGCCNTTRPIQLYYAADALTCLPDAADAAERYSERAIEAYRDVSAPGWDFGCQACSYADLAVARIRRGELEGAIEALTPVLELPTDQRINGIVQSVQRVRGALASSAMAAVSRDIQEEIEIFTRMPVRAISTETPTTSLPRPESSPRNGA